MDSSITFTRWRNVTQTNTCFRGPNRVHNPNGISIGSTVFAGITIVTDRPTYRPCYSVCNNRPLLRAMQPNNFRTIDLWDRSNQGRNHVFKVGGPIPWSRLLYRTKYGWYTQFRALLRKKLGWSVQLLGVRTPNPPVVAPLVVATQFDPL